MPGKRTPKEMLDLRARLARLGMLSPQPPTLFRGTMQTPTPEQTREILRNMVEAGWLLPGNRTMFGNGPENAEGFAEMRRTLARLADPDGFIAWEIADVAAEASRALDAVEEIEERDQ